MLDGSAETCWNSHQGSPQWIVIGFPGPVDVAEVRIMFQGGFVGQECQFLASEEEQGGGSFTFLSHFYPEETNSTQVFQCQAKGVRQLKILFGASTDFYGRVTIYQLDVLGESR